MAIGLGKMFGFHFPENFNYPYVSQSVREFWHRWHISLSTWFRDYLYIPLGGNRVSPARSYLNLVVVFFLCGLWHGASWAFVVWGLYHGCFLIVERTAPGRWFEAKIGLFRHLYALVVVVVGWVFFRSDSLAVALGYLASMAGLGRRAAFQMPVATYLTNDVAIALVAGFLGSTPWVKVLARRLEVRPLAPSLQFGLNMMVNGALILVFVVSLTLVASGTYNPFIYFRF